MKPRLRFSVRKGGTREARLTLPDGRAYGAMFSPGVTQGEVEQTIALLLNPDHQRRLDQGLPLRPTAAS